jgi:tetratricopeptide (TPR) repeat protein
VAGVISYDDLPPKVQAKLDSLYQACDFKRYGDAVGGLTKIVDKYPNYIHGAFVLGMALRESRQPARAAERFAEAAKVAPRDPRVLLGLAWSRLDAKDIKGSRRFAARALPKAEPLYRGEVVAALAMADEADGKIDQAAERYLEAYEVGTKLRWLKAHCRLAGIEYGLDGEGTAVRWPMSLRVRRQLYASVSRDLNVAARAKDPEIADEDALIAGCDSTAGLTARWAKSAGIDRARLYQALASRGGFCDCEVLMNVADNDAEVWKTTPEKAKVPKKRSGANAKRQNRRGQKAQ